MMERGDVALVLIILMLLVAIALITANMDVLFPTPTVKQAIMAVNST